MDFLTRYIIPDFAIAIGIRQKIRAFFLHKKVWKYLKVFPHFFSSQKYPSFSSRFSIPIAKAGILITALFLCGDLLYAEKYYGQSINPSLFLNKNKLNEARKGVVKRRVSGIVKSLQSTALKTKRLDYFGKITMVQGAEVLDIGSQSVEFFSVYVDSKSIDWKVKYWVADMLAYFEGGDAVKVLNKIKNNKNLKYQVRKKAADSLAEVKKK